MDNCLICGDKLGMLNKPMFGFGKTKDGGRVCTKCNQGLAKRKSSYSNNISKYTTDEFLEGIRYSKIKEVRERLAEINHKLLKMPEAFQLPFFITDAETIERAEQGFLAEGASSLSNGLVVVTNERVVILDVNSSPTSTKMSMEEFALSDITSISFESGFAKSKITIVCNGNSSSINILKGGDELSQYIRQKISQYKKNSQQPQLSNSDPLDQIKKLKDLFDSGILTEAEFELKKKELLNKL